MNPFIFCFLRAKNTRKSGSESQIFKQILRTVHRFAVHIVHDLQKMQIAATRGGKDDALFPCVSATACREPCVVTMCR